MHKSLLIFCCAALFAQSPKQNPPQETQDTPFRIGVTNVLVPVTVQDRQHNDVAGLTTYDFRLFDNKRPQKISEDLAQHPISV
ncbi:MAG TPA: hypothetical protein VKS01_07940, partial [Bryobacteraceae bacterium]|nr:hypothetical protein [Bryobacteraceae bacterium]